MTKRFTDEDVQQAVGRILMDRQSPGDGVLLLDALVGIQANVSHVLQDACALSAEWGRRKLAQDLIEIGKKEFQRVHASLPSSNAPSSSASPLSDASSSNINLNSIATRRRGPILAVSRDDS